MKIFPCLLILFCFAFPNTSLAQTQVRGQVSDAQSKEPLIGVNVRVSPDQGTATDLNGHFALNLSPGSYTLIFTYLSYEETARKITLSQGEILQLDIQMKEAAEQLDIITVTGSKFEKNITEETVSIDVIKPEFMERNNNTSLAEVIERVPGVQVIDGQANIRGGSGFAFGAGSRVAFLVDEQPLLSADLSDIKWNFVPIENAGQVEIIKGAASVLYGSAGLNGVINMRTATPALEPYTALTLYSGIHIIPNDKDRRWYDKLSDQPLLSGAYLAHREKLTPNLDLVLGSNIHYQNGFLKGGDERRARFTFTTKYRPPEKKGNLSIGINGNLMYHELGTFFLSQDANERAYYHIADPFDRDRYISLTLDPHITFFDKAENKHLLRLRYFNITKMRSPDPNAPTALYSGEYQFQTHFEKDMVLTAGATGQFFTAKSQLFDKSDSTFVEGDTIINLVRQNGTMFAAYAQIDKKFSSRFNATAGLRWEAFSFQNAVSTSLPVLRGGLNYRLGSKHYLRMSFGQGFRVPSLGERFIDDDVEDKLRILPNPDLETETGWSTEIGYKQPIIKKNWKGFVDIAAFWMEYNNMTEFHFDLHRPDSIVSIRPLPDIHDYQTYLGFRSVNISEARIAGFEISASGEGKIGNIPLRLWGGYTYSFPADLSADSTQSNVGTFLKNLGKAFFNVDSTLASGILKYRTLHVIRMDAEIDINNWTIGTAIAFNSFMHNVDDILVSKGQYAPLVELFNGGPIVPGLIAFREEHRKGDWIFDLRLSYQFPHDKVSLIFNNIFNREYAIRPAKMNAPLGITLRWKHIF